MLLAGVGVAAPAGGATAQLPAPPLEGTHACRPAPFVTHLRVRSATCRRARQVSHFWEQGGRCPAGWRFRRYALPAGVEATGGSYLSCRHGSARVFWAENGE